MAGKARDQLHNPTERSENLRSLLRESLRYERADVLLLSGGLDSSVLAVLDRKTPAYTIGMKGMGEKEDLKFAGTLAKRLDLEWHPILLTREEAIDNLRAIIRMTETYNLALLNDLALFVATKRALEYTGLQTIVVRSGEPADLLFRGYFYTYDIPKSLLSISIDKTDRSKLPLAAFEPHMRIRVDYPFLDQKIREFAKNLEIADNVMYRNIPGGTWDTHPSNPERLIGPPYPLGKTLLRRAFYADLPKAIAERKKTDIQFGSGTDSLNESYLEQIVSDKELLEYTKSGIHFRSRAHAGMYKIYREEGLRPKPPTKSEEECKWCHGVAERGIDERFSYCKTCGGYPSNYLPDESWLYEKG